MSNTKSMKDPSLIGLQHEAYKTSKGTLLAWINDFYDLDYKKPQDACYGAVYCQVVDSLFPDEFSKSWKKVKWNYRNQETKNWKLLQEFFNKKKVTKPIPINDLIEGKMMANLEFMQWMKYFFDYHYNGQSYDATARRKGIASSGGGKKYVPGKSAKSSKQSKASKKTGKVKDSGAGKRASGRKKADPEEIARLENIRLGLEKERDFYFEKLRQIEIMLQAMPESVKEVNKADVLKILYETDENFEQPEPEEDDTF